jgi:hypothetical protein
VRLIERLADVAEITDARPGVSMRMLFRAGRPSPAEV